MQPDEARRALGVGPEATHDQLRQAWRRLVRQSHPDVAPDGADAGGRTARLNTAYALLRSLPPRAVAPPPRPPTMGPAPPPEQVGSDSGLLVFDLAATPTFLRLLEAAHRLGDVTHLDLDGGLLEILVDEPGVGTCSVLVDVEGRPDGTTAAAVSIEVLSDPLAIPEASFLRHVLEDLAAAV